MSTTPPTQPDPGPVLLLTVTTFSEAQVVANLLESEGIPCLIKRTRSKRRSLFRVTFGLHQGACDLFVPGPLLEQAASCLEEARRAGEALAEGAELESEDGDSDGGNDSA